MLKKHEVIKKKKIMNEPKKIEFKMPSNILNAL